MKSTIAILLSLFVALILTPKANAQLDTSNPSISLAVQAADDARIAAMRSPERERLSEVFSDDLRYAHSTGVVDTKSSFIDVLVSGKTKYLGYDHIERTVTTPAPKIALIAGRARIQAESANSKMDNTLSYLSVWREENGKWRFLAWQSCKLPVPTTP